MAKGAKFKKYSRRTQRAKISPRVWIIALAIVAFIALSLIISIAVGSALGKRAAATVNGGLDIAVEPYYSGDRMVQAVNTGTYEMNFDVSDIKRGKVGLSFCLQDDLGNLGYDPAIGFAPEGVKLGEHTVASHTEYIKKHNGYICGYIFVRTFDIKDEYQREIYRAYEMALIHNATANGVNEVLLVLPRITDSNINEIERYVSDASKASQGGAVGVLLSSELYQITESGVYYASRLRAVCDFAALDLRRATASDIESILEKNEFYIKSYPLRGVFCKSNKAVADIAREYGMTSIQIIGDEKNTSKPDESEKK